LGDREEDRYLTRVPRDSISPVLKAIRSGTRVTDGFAMCALAERRKSSPGIKTRVN